MEEDSNIQNEDTPLISPLSARVYRRRWIILLSFFAVNLSNGMLWITYASIADLTANFYKTGSIFVNLLALVFPLIISIFGLLVSWSLLRINLRMNLWICGIVNVIAGGLRILSSAPISLHNGLRLALVMGGQLLAGVAQPFIMFSSTTLAVDWFAEDQRAMANTIASMGNPAGILAANIISPLVATVAKDIFRINVIYAIPSVVSLLFVIFFVTRSKPPTPPYNNREATERPEGASFVSFKDSFNLCFRSKSFLMLVFGFSVGMGLFTALSTFLEQILCPIGYSDSFAGVCGAVLIGAGVIAAGIISMLVDKTGTFNTAVKLSFGIAAFTSIIFFILINVKDMHVAIIIVVSCYGASAFAAYPVALELGAEITYPASETVSSGLLIQGGQVMSCLLIVVIQFTAVQLPDAPYSVCKDGNPQSYRIPGYIISGLVCFTSAPLLLIFHGVYRRRRAERNSVSQVANAVAT